MNKRISMAFAIALMTMMIFSSFVGIVAVPSARAAPTAPVTEAAPSAPADVSGVNEIGDDFVVLEEAVVNWGDNPIIGQAGVPVNITLNSTVMDNMREDDGDDVLWNVTLTILPTFYWWNPVSEEWEETMDISFSVDAWEVGQWWEDVGPDNALWNNPDDEDSKYVPWYMAQAWDDAAMDFIDADNDGAVEVDYTDDGDADWEARNITAYAKTFSGFELDIAGDAEAGEYMASVEVSYRYNTHVDVDPDQDGDDDPSTTADDATTIGDYTGLNVNMPTQNMWQNAQPLGDWMWYYWVPWNTATNAMPADIRDVVWEFGANGVPGLAAEDDVENGLDDNDNWLEFGPDGAPGVKGTDDDGNGIIDDPTEAGFGDDHDKDGDGVPSVDWDGPYDDFNGDGDYDYDPEPFVDEGNTFNDVAWFAFAAIVQNPDDDGDWEPNEEMFFGAMPVHRSRGLLFPADIRFEDDGVGEADEYNANEYLVAAGADTNIDPTDHCYYPLWDSTTYYPAAPVAYQTAGRAVSDLLCYEDGDPVGGTANEWDPGEGVWLDAGTSDNGVYNAGVDTLIIAGNVADTDAGNHFTTDYTNLVHYDVNGNSAWGSNEIMWEDTGATPDFYDAGEAVLLTSYHGIAIDAAAYQFAAGAAPAFANSDWNWRYNSGEVIWDNEVVNTAAPDNIALPQCLYDRMDQDNDGYPTTGDYNLDENSFDTLGAYDNGEISWINSDDGTARPNLAFNKITNYYEPEDGDIWYEGALWNDWEAIRDDGAGDPSSFVTTLPNNTWTLTGQNYFDEDNDGQAMWFDATVLSANQSIRWALQEAWHNFYINSYNELGTGIDRVAWTVKPVPDQFPYDANDGNGTWQYSGYEGDTVWAMNGADYFFTEVENFTFEVDPAADVMVHADTTTFYAGDVFESFILVATPNEDGEDAVITLDATGLTGIELIVEDAYVPEIEAGEPANFYYRVTVDRTTPPGIYEVPYTLTYMNDDDVTVISTGTVDIIVDFTPVIVVRDWAKPNFDQGDIRETFTVTFENVGNVPLRGINMTLDVGDRDDDLYPTQHQYEQGNGTGAWTTFDLSVRLDEPGVPMDIGDTVTASFPAGILSAIPAGSHMIPFKYTAFFEDDGSTENPSRFVEVVVCWRPGNTDNGLLDGFNDLDLMKAVIEDPMGAAAPHPIGVYENYHSDAAFPPTTGYSIYGVRDIYIDANVNMIEWLQAQIVSGPVFLDEDGVGGQTTDIPVIVRLWNNEEEMNIDNVGDDMSDEWGEFALTDIQATLLKTDDSPFATAAIAEVEENATLFWGDWTDLEFIVDLEGGLAEDFYTVPIRITATNTMTGDVVTRFVNVVFDLHYPMIEVFQSAASDVIMDGGQILNLDFAVDIFNDEGFGLPFAGAAAASNMVDIIIVADSSGYYNNNGLNWEDMEFEISNFENWLYDITVLLEAQGMDVNAKVYILWEVQNIKNMCPMAVELDVGYFDDTNNGVNDGIIAPLKEMIINDNNQRPKEAWAQAAAYIAQAEQEWRPGASRYVIPMGTEMPYDETTAGWPNISPPTANDNFARQSLIDMALEHGVNVIPVWGAYRGNDMANIDADVVNFMTGAASTDMPALSFWDANSAQTVANAMVGGRGVAAPQIVDFEYVFANLTVGGNNLLNDPTEPMTQGAGIISQDVGFLGDATVFYTVDKNDVDAGMYTVRVTIEGVSVLSGQKISIIKTFDVRYFPAPPNLTIKESATTTIVPGQPFELELAIYNAGTDTAYDVDVLLDGQLAEYDWDILIDFIDFMTPWTEGCCNVPTNLTIGGAEDWDGELDWSNNYFDWRQQITMDDLGLDDAEDIYDLYDYHNRSQSSPQAKVKRVHIDSVEPGQWVNITFVVNVDSKAIEGKVYPMTVTFSHVDSFGTWRVQEAEAITVQTGTGDVIRDDENGFEFNDTLTYVCLGIFAVIVIIIIVALAVTGRGNGGDDDDFEELIEDDDFDDEPKDEPKDDEKQE